MMKIQTMQKQKGISFWGFVWGAAFFICLTVVLVRSLPPYMNDQKISAALEMLAEEPKVMTASRASLLRSLKRRLRIDYADEYVNLDKAFTVKNIKTGRELAVNYEVVVPLFYNASLLFDFKNNLLVTKNP